MKDVEESVKSTSLQSDSPIVNDYLVKMGIILYSSEIENDLKELVSRKLAGYKSFCQLCNKLRNPKFGDIQAVLKDLKLQVLNLDEDKVSKYSNLIVARDQIAHRPDYSAQLTLKDLQICINIGKEILTHIDTVTSV